MTKHLGRALPLFAGLLAAYLLAAGLLYWIGADQMEFIESRSSSVTPMANDGGLAGTNVLEQSFQAQTDTLDQLELYLGTFGRENNSTLCMEILEGETLLWRQEYAAAGLANMEVNEIGRAHV